MLIIVFFIHETLHVAERTKLFLCSLFFVLCPPPPYNTHAVPFTVAPTPLQIQAAIDHQEAKRREKENSMSTAFHMKASRLGGRREVEDDASSQSSYSNDGEESVSSVGSGSTGGASSGTERSRNRLVTQLRRAHHDTPFMAGGRVFYAPRRPHTRGSRNLTGMELEVMPLVTGARESVEHATSLESPRRAAHPSWTPHVELEPHPTFGKKYHGHHLHVHHHEGGHGGHKSGKDPGEDDDDPHAHKHHHHHHKHHHHHHHHGKGGHKRGRPKTLKECILSHETDVKVLSEAYRAEAMKFPPSWKQAADEAAAAAQQVIVHKTETKAPVVEVQRAHGSHHNVYATEAHGKPPGTHRNLQNLVIQAKKSANNKTLARFKARSYKKVLALQIQKQSAAQLAERKRMNRKCQDLTAKHAELIVMGRRSQARRDQQSRQTARELQEFLREGRRPTTSFSKPIVQPGFPSAQKRGGSGRGMGQRPQTTTPIGSGKGVKDIAGIVDVDPAAAKETPGFERCKRGAILAFEPEGILGDGIQHRVQRYLFDQPPGCAQFDSGGLQSVVGVQRTVVEDQRRAGQFEEEAEEETKAGDSSGWGQFEFRRPWRVEYCCRRGGRSQLRYREVRAQRGGAASG